MVKGKEEEERIVVPSGLALAQRRKHDEAHCVWNGWNWELKPYNAHKKRQR